MAAKQSQDRDRAQELVDAFYGAIEEMKAEAEAQRPRPPMPTRPRRRPWRTPSPQWRRPSRGSLNSRPPAVLIRAPFRSPCSTTTSPALKAIQKSEKQRKRDLEKAQKDLEKATEAAAKVRVNLGAEASGAAFVAIRAQRQIDNTVVQILRALQEALDAQKLRSVVVDDYGMLDESKRLQPRGRIHEADLENAQRAQERWAEEFTVAL
jgi:hypothetical protein